METPCICWPIWGHQCLANMGTLLVCHYGDTSGWLILGHHWLSTDVLSILVGQYVDKIGWPVWGHYRLANMGTLLGWPIYRGTLGMAHIGASLVIQHGDTNVLWPICG